MHFKLLSQRYRLIQNTKKLFPAFRYLTLASQKMTEIQNFIFFDIETTGLPYEEYNKTRITEMCFVAVQGEHISLGVYPRVQNKLSLCFNPQKMISPIATELTGLSNELLEYQSTFNANTSEMIIKFLELHRKPLCLVAHNGDRFDYPILKAELHKTGCKLYDDILCIDSLEMFRQLDQPAITELKESSHDSTVSSIPEAEIPVELCDGFDAILCDAVESYEYESRTIEKAQITNETTPKKTVNVTHITDQRVIHDSLRDHLYFAPTPSNKTASFSDDSTKSNDNPPKARKRLDFGKRSYKLIDVYKRMTNKENDNAHFASADVDMLIHCAATLGQDFVAWANTHAKKLSEVPMMKPGVKLGS
ncbi:three prime repair exonuclease 1 2 [Holotrichia oblita]|uniref:Three prime repair exonuclease 1 2 n=1 Tax=Holotrichia oblita TaxID=644536 RepID=A0ACB9TY51_HOLOL|nr:three prime repair exonuclease 1 2 [Holotrichia oblita]